jgi:hypothetical protein
MLIKLLSLFVNAKSEFAEIFDLEHFNNILANYVQVDLSLPKYKRLSHIYLI